jgi:hypothetical protein
VPVEFETYAFNLDYANKYDIPQWELIYNYTDSYGLKDLSPQSFLDFANKMHYEEEAAILFRNHKHINHVESNEPCNFECRMYHYCQVVSNNYDDWMFCNDNSLFDLIHAPVLSMMQTVGHSWFVQYK